MPSIENVLGSCILALLAFTWTAHAQSPTAEKKQASANVAPAAKDQASAAVGQIDPVVVIQEHRCDLGSSVELGAAAFSAPAKQSDCLDQIRKNAARARDAKTLDIASSLGAGAASYQVLKHSNRLAAGVVPTGTVTESFLIDHGVPKSYSAQAATRIDRILKTGPARAVAGVSVLVFASKAAYDAWRQGQTDFATDLVVYPSQAASAPPQTKPRP